MSRTDRCAGLSPTRPGADPPGQAGRGQGYTSPVPDEATDNGFPSTEEVDVDALFAALKEELRRPGADPGAAGGPGRGGGGGAEGGDARRGGRSGSGGRAGRSRPARGARRGGAALARVRRPTAS